MKTNKPKKQKYLIVRQSGKANSTFKVTNPKKIDYWIVMAHYVSASATSVHTEILEEGYLK